MTTSNNISFDSQSDSESAIMTFSESFVEASFFFFGSQSDSESVTMTINFGSQSNNEFVIMTTLSNLSTSFKQLLK